MQKKNILLLAFVFLFTNVYAMEDFTDTSTHWAKEYIEDLNNKNLIKGYENNTFRPDNEILNVEVYSIINRIASYNKEEEINLSLEDKENESWYYKDLKKAEAAGYVKIDNNFKIEPITRLEMSKIIAKVYDLKDNDTEVNYFKDYNYLNLDEKKAVSALVKNNIIKGYEDNTFRPEGKLTRAEFCKIISLSQKNLTLPNIDKEVEDIDELNNLKNDLLNLIKKTKYMDLSRYSQESISNLNSAIFKGEKILEENSTITEVKEMIKEIEEASRSLKYISEDQKLVFNIVDNEGNKVDAKILINDEEFINGSKIAPGRYFVRINYENMQEYQTYLIVDNEDKEINIELKKESKEKYKLHLSKGLSSSSDSYNKNERVTVKVNIPDGMEIDEFLVNGKEKHLLSDEYIFFITEDTEIKVNFIKK